MAPVKKFMSRSYVACASFGFCSVTYSKVCAIYQPSVGHNILVMPCVGVSSSPKAASSSSVGASP